ncbi:cyclodeaminase/cyclohydrolase family protein [bacterium]|nr:cyclodeaminase/cyclohydrolase family protein [bacterium]
MVQARLTESTVREYTARLASGEPTPGGGSAAALVGALAAALGEMVGNFTVGKEKFAAVEEEVRAILAVLTVQREKLLDLTDEDAAAYAGVGAAYALPKGTEEEKVARTAAIQEALRAAAQVPLAVCDGCLSVMGTLEDLRARGNPNLLSDVAVAAEFCCAAMRCACLNVDVNLAYLKDEAYVAETRAALDERRECLESVSRALFDRILAQIRG